MLVVSPGLTRGTGWMKCNVYGFVVQQGRSACCAGGFHSAAGAWRLGFTWNLGSGNAFLAELWGVISALEVAWDNGIQKLCIECDSRVVVDFILHGCGDAHPYRRYIRVVDSWRSQQWEVQFAHVYREANCVADWLAHFGHSLCIGLHIFQHPPKGCSLLPLKDQMGVGLQRRVLV